MPYYIGRINEYIAPRLADNSILPFVSKIGYMIFDRNPPKSRAVATLCNYRTAESQD